MGHSRDNRNQQVATVATIEERTDSKGNTTFRVKVRIRGEKPRTRTFKRKTDAKAWAAKAESDIGHGVYVPTTADRTRTLADLIDKTIAEHLPTKDNNKSADKVATLLQWWRAEMGEVTLDKLTPDRIRAARATLRARKTRKGTPLTAATANRYLAALSVATKWAWKELGWLPRNPVLEISKGGESAGIVRSLSNTERTALVAAAKASGDPNMHTAIMLALATGQRAGALRSLTWADVDFDRRALRLINTKNGESRWVPLIDIAFAELKAHLERDPTKEGWLFKSTTREAAAEINGKVWMDTKRAAGLTGDANFRFHDLRHTAGTYLNEAGASAIQIAAALGHKTLAMAQRYSHQSPEFTRSVFDKIGSRIAGEGAE